MCLHGPALHLIHPSVWVLLLHSPRPSGELRRDAWLCARARAANTAQQWTFKTWCGGQRFHSTPPRHSRQSESPRSRSTEREGGREGGSLIRSSLTDYAHRLSYVLRFMASRSLLVRPRQRTGSTPSACKTTTPSSYRGEASAAAGGGRRGVYSASGDV